MTPTCFIGPAQGVRRFDPSPPPEKHEEEMPNPMPSATLHLFGFGMLATALELVEAGDAMENLNGPGRGHFFNPDALRPERMIKPSCPGSMR